MKFTCFALVDAFHVVAVAFEGAELVEVVLEVADNAGGSVLEEEFDEVEGLGGVGGTLRILRQLLLFLSFSQMNSLMRCHFSLSGEGSTSCRRRWRSRAVAALRPASFPRKRPTLASRPDRHLRSSPSWVSADVQFVGTVFEFLKHQSNIMVVGLPYLM